MFLQYIMVELRSAVDDAVVPGYERSGCVLLNVNGLRLPLRWGGSGAVAGANYGDGSAVATPQAPTPAVPPPAGSKVFLRIFFRDATIFAFGIS